MFTKSYFSPRYVIIYTINNNLMDSGSGKAFKYVYQYIIMFTHALSEPAFCCMHYIEIYFGFSAKFVDMWHVECQL